jgi:Flp pilus assembly pilin Flp
MMKQSTIDCLRNDEGITTMVEYASISAILVVLLIVIMFSVNAAFMEEPANKVRYYAFTDIGNGISARIVDIYLIAPENGTITTMFDIPDEVMMGPYFVDVTAGIDQNILVHKGDIKSTISLSGIGATKGVMGKTTGSGWNRITYDSRGVN